MDHRTSSPFFPVWGIHLAGSTGRDGIEGPHGSKARGVILGIVLAVTVGVWQREDGDEAMGLVIRCLLIWLRRQ